MVEQYKEKEKGQQLLPHAILGKRDICFSALVYILSNVEIIVTYEVDKCEKMTVVNIRHYPSILRHT
jgi:hypothetical protein